MITFHVGQKVVAVGRQGRPAPPSRRLIDRNEGSAVKATYPVLGQVYTIRQINAWDDGVTLLLEEICNRRLIGWKGSTMEPGFPAECFRPVVQRKADISIFKSMLNPVRERAGA